MSKIVNIALSSDDIDKMIENENKNDDIFKYIVYYILFIVFISIQVYIYIYVQMQFISLQLHYIEGSISILNNKVLL